MKLNLIFMLVVSSLLYSCTGTVAEFEVINTTDKKVENFIIQTSGVVSDDFIEIDPEDSITYKVDMNDVPKTDGNYILSYQLDGKNTQEEFGYYSNGIPLDGTIRIEILPLMVRITPVSN